MTPDERDLRRALETRSGEASPEFRRRISDSLLEGRPAANAMPAIALVAAVVLSVASIGILLMARGATYVSHGGVTSTTRLTSPSPTPTGKGGGLFLPLQAEISATAGNVVWVYFAQGFLFRSTDRGDTWEQRPVPPIEAGLWPEISFVDAQNGWYSTSGSPETQCNAQQTSIWHTADGGATWQNAGTAGISESQCKAGLSFVDANHGFLAAWDDNHQPIIYRTSDAGRMWKASAPLPDAPGFVTQSGGFTLRAWLVRAFGSTLLVAVTDQKAGQYVYRSTDGGATWSYLATVDGGPGFIVFATPSRWLQMQTGSGGSETTDAGRTWHPFPNDYSDAAGIASFFYFADDRVGYGTVRGTIHRTTDGGSHWVVLKTPGT
jgi:photosystem II stability/assembly factor-like uncharacterized protein